MSQKRTTETLSLAVGAALAGSLTFAPNLQASENPFGLQPLSGGYLQLADNHGGDKKAGESDDKKSEDKDDKKAEEGKCGGAAKAGEGKCGGEKAKEGKCGEGKCGSKH